MDKNKFERLHMEKSWENIDKEYKKTIVEETIRKFYEFLKSRKLKGSLLDIGCGSGKNTVFFDKRGFESLGVDFSSNAIKRCKDYAGKKNSNAKFKVLDVVRDKFPKKEYGVVLDCGCLHHIRKQYWSKYRKNVLKSIKKGGFFYLHGFCDESYKLGVAPKNRNWRLREGHYTHFFSDEEIKKLFGKYFKILKTYKYKSLSKKFIVKAFYMKRK